MKNSQKIQELLTRGVEQVIVKKNLTKRLQSGKVLRVKHGIDPTGPKIHIGRAVQLWKLRAFQELGHQIILIIGDFTAHIGDASDKQAKRKILSDEQIQANFKDYEKQIGKILDLSKTEIHKNSEWLSKMSARQLIDLEMHFTANQMILRKNFKERFYKNKDVGLHELNYPIFQGYDSIAIKADVEIGGNDQLFNLKCGRKLQKIFGQEPQDIMTSKMVNGLDGRKMSTSWGNIITIVDKPQEIFGKIMSMRDELISEYFELCTPINLKELKEIKRALKNKAVNPRDLKARLGHTLVEMYYDKKAASQAEQEFNQVFKLGQIPSKIPTHKTKKKKQNILELLVNTKLAQSKSQAKRLIMQKGVKIDGKVLQNWQEDVMLKNQNILQVGKRKFIKIIF